jgi:hypothetical protein
VPGIIGSFSTVRNGLAERIPAYRGYIKMRVCAEASYGNRQRFMFLSGKIASHSILPARVSGKGGLI